MKLAILLVMLCGGLGAVIRAFITNICNEKFNSSFYGACLPPKLEF